MFGGRSGDCWRDPETQKQTCEGLGKPYQRGLAASHLPRIPAMRNGIHIPNGIHTYSTSTPQKLQGSVCNHRRGTYQRTQIERKKIERKNSERSLKKWVNISEPPRWNKSENVLNFFKQKGFFYKTTMFHEKNPQKYDPKQPRPGSNGEGPLYFVPQAKFFLKV